MIWCKHWLEDDVKQLIKNIHSYPDSLDAAGTTNPGNKRAPA